MRTICRRCRRYFGITESCSCYLELQGCAANGQTGQFRQPKVSLDVPIMVDKRPENIRRAAKAVGNLQVLSHFGGEYDRDNNGKIKGAKFYKPFIQAMHEIGYSGYLSYELCHPLPKVNGQTVGLEFAEKNAKLAAEFMRGIITEVTKS